MPLVCRVQVRGNPRDGRNGLCGLPAPVHGLDVRRAVGATPLLLQLRGALGRHGGKRRPSRIPAICRHHAIRIDGTRPVSRWSVWHRRSRVPIVVLPIAGLRYASGGEGISVVGEEARRCAGSTRRRGFGGGGEVGIGIVWNLGAWRLLTRSTHLRLETQWCRRLRKREPRRRSPCDACHGLGALARRRPCPQARARSGARHCACHHLGGVASILRQRVGQRVGILLFIIIMLSIGVLQAADLRLHPGEVRWRLVGALGSLWSILLPLLIEADGPFLHHAFILELDHEVFHPRVPLPPYLYRVGACIVSQGGCQEGRRAVLTCL